MCIVDPTGIADEEAYLTAVRSGRPRITREQRRLVWAVFRMFQRGLHKRNLLTFDGATHQARLAVEHGNFQPGSLASDGGAQPNGGIRP